MICCRDKTFCPFYVNCARAADCHRALTDEVRAAASAWWGDGDAPICVFTDPPSCHEISERSR